jgi:Nucleotidyltransferase domain
MEVDFTGCVDRLARAGLWPADARSVFCVGSLARGWSNPNSDCDLCVVGDEPFDHADLVAEPVSLRPDFVGTAVLHVDGRRWEIKYWTVSQVEQMLAKVSEESFSAGRSSTLTAPEELLLERLLTAYPIDGESWLVDQRKRVEESCFREHVVTRSLNKADGAVEDALGCLRAGDLYSAVLAAQLAFAWMVDAVLENAGCFGSRTRKWRARRMLDAAPTALPFAEYWAMETMADLDRENPEPWVRAVVAWCKKTAMEIDI